jgi:hypothetical protein
MIQTMRVPNFPPGWPSDAMAGDDVGETAAAAWLVAIGDQPGDGAARLRWVLAAARIPTGDTARLLGRDRRLVARWISGAVPIPLDVWPALARLAAIAG